MRGRGCKSYQRRNTGVNLEGRPSFKDLRLSENVFACSPSKILLLLFLNLLRWKRSENRSHYINLNLQIFNFSAHYFCIYFCIIYVQLYLESLDAYRHSFFIENVLCHANILLLIKLLVDRT